MANDVSHRAFYMSDNVGNKVVVFPDDAMTIVITSTNALMNAITVSRTASESVDDAAATS